MRICLLAHGSSIHTKRWATFFRDAGHDVHVVSLTDAEPLPGMGWHVLGRPARIHQERTNWVYLRSLPRLRRLLRDLSPDLLNAHFLSSNGVLGALTLPSRCRFVVTLLGSDVLVIARRKRVLRAAAAWALGRADLVTSVAEHMTAAVRELFGPVVPVETFPYGVDRTEFVPGGPPGEREPVVLSTRRLASFANLDVVVEAARRIAEAGDVPLRFRFVGTGDRREEIESLAAPLTRAGRAVFTGPLPAEDFTRELRDAALYVSMTASDGASLSLLEAMASGAFPVVSDIPANREWIDDGENGFLVPVGDAAALADALGRAWTAAELRRRAADRNLDLVAARADFRSNLERIEERFRGLVARER